MLPDASLSSFSPGEQGGKYREYRPQEEDSHADDQISKECRPPENKKSDRFNTAAFQEVERVNEQQSPERLQKVNVQPKALADSLDKAVFLLLHRLRQTVENYCFKPFPQASHGK